MLRRLLFSTVECVEVQVASPVNPKLSTKGPTTCVSVRVFQGSIKHARLQRVIALFEQQHYQTHGGSIYGWIQCL